jgi:hypothetical protein
VNKALDGAALAERLIAESNTEAEARAEAQRRNGEQNA